MEQNKIPDTTAVIVFAKSLDVPSKTRIARTEGRADARKIYRELLSATSATLHSLPYHVACAGSEVPGELSDYFSTAVSFFPQVEGDLGVRMKQACRYLEKKGYRSFIVIGCDCPERREEDIVQAAYYLNNGTDVVLGPVEDGGYHLAGVNESGVIIFNATRWSTPELMNETIAIVKKADLSLFTLPTRCDIDTIEDYRLWKQRA